LNYPEKIYKIYLKNADRLALREFLGCKTQQVSELKEKLQTLSEQNAMLEANRKEVESKADDAERMLSAERQVFLWQKWLKTKNFSAFEHSTKSSSETAKSDWFVCFHRDFYKAQKILLF
jgi:uncharacterized protein YjcR